MVPGPATVYSCKVYSLLLPTYFAAQSLANFLAVDRTDLAALGILVEGRSSGLLTHVYGPVSQILHCFFFCNVNIIVDQKLLIWEKGFAKIPFCYFVETMTNISSVF